MGAAAASMGEKVKLTTAERIAATVTAMKLAEAMNAADDGNHSKGSGSGGKKKGAALVRFPMDAAVDLLGRCFPPSPVKRTPDPLLAGTGDDDYYDYDEFEDDGGGGGGGGGGDGGGEERG